MHCGLNTLVILIRFISHLCGDIDSDNGDGAVILTKLCNATDSFVTVNVTDYLISVELCALVKFYRIQSNAEKRKMS